MAPECNSHSDVAAVQYILSLTAVVWFLVSAAGVVKISGGGGATKCQLLLRTPPVIVSTIVPSLLTRISPTSSNSPVTGLIDHKSINVPGNQPPLLGKVMGAGVAKTISPG